MVTEILIFCQCNSSYHCKINGVIVTYELTSIAQYLEVWMVFSIITYLYIHLSKARWYAYEQLPPHLQKLTGFLFCGAIFKKKTLCFVRCTRESNHVVEFIFKLLFTRFCYATEVHCFAINLCSTQSVPDHSPQLLPLCNRWSSVFSGFAVEQLSVMVIECKTGELAFVLLWMHYDYPWLLHSVQM